MAWMNAKTGNRSQKFMNTQASVKVLKDSLEPSTGTAMVWTSATQCRTWMMKATAMKDLAHRTISLRS
ncbi:hypothetical protein DIPPA_19478 [Diplonema papillatum]|nr:hypothetical protein DIPPA_19478 [Diplonema papillatum]